MSERDFAEWCDRQAAYSDGVIDAAETMQVLRRALQDLYKADTMLRLRVVQIAPAIKEFSDWKTHTKAMRVAESVIRKTA